MKRKKIETVKYEDIPLFPMLFQDDIANPADSVEDAQSANDKIEEMIETKLLNLNYEKSKFIVIGQKKARNEMKKKLENNP